MSAGALAVRVFYWLGLLAPLVFGQATVGPWWTLALTYPWLVVWEAMFNYWLRAPKAFEAWPAEYQKVRR